MKPTVSIGLISHNRPIMLREAVSAMYREPGHPFELILFSSGSNPETLEVERWLSKKYGFKLIVSKKNIGFKAIPTLLKRATGKYYVWYEDDFIWLEPNWLKKLVYAMENHPPFLKKKWGILSAVNIVDSVTNGAMWSSHFDGARLLEHNGTTYMITNTACGSVFMFNRKLAMTFPEFQDKRLKKVKTKSINFLSRYRGIDIPVFGTYDAIANSAFTSRGFPVAHVNIKCYHANGPFYGSLYQDQVNEKQQDSHYLVDAAAIIKKGKEEGWEFNPDGKYWILDALRCGTFREYADNLFASLEEP